MHNIINLPLHDTLRASLDTFLSEPSSSMPVKCRLCGLAGHMTHEKSFSKLPRILVLNIDRQYFHKGEVYKDPRKVSFPDSLILEVKEQEVSLRHSYSLSAFICHSGASVQSGHYTAFIKRGKKWFLCNDQATTEGRGSYSSNEVIFFYELVWT